MKELELYLHIPFCVKKCNYCDFLSAPAEEKTRAAYVDTLIREIEDFEEPEDYEVVTVFFGGGTPSILPGEAILRLMEALRKKFHFREEAEITLEANPGTVDEKKLSFYKKAGINRLSFGLQSTDAEELKSWAGSTPGKNSSKALSWRGKPVFPISTWISCLLFRGRRWKAGRKRSNRSSP